MIMNIEFFMQGNLWMMKKFITVHIQYILILWEKS